jgi:hypothetical protein
MDDDTIITANNDTITGAKSGDGRDRCTGQFLPGHKWSLGRGRPVGARDRHSRNFLESFAADFETHGPQVIEQVRKEKPDVYLKIAADLLPREAKLDVTVDLFADVQSFGEAFQLATEAIGGDADAALRRLRKSHPWLIEHDVGS